MRWFGESWGAPCCKNEEDQINTPIGRQCEVCDEKIKEENQGFLIPFAGVTLEDLELNPCVVVVGGIPHLTYHLDCLLDSLGVKGNR